MEIISQHLIGYENHLENLSNNLIIKSSSNSFIFYGNKGIGKNTFTHCLINKIFSDKFNESKSNLLYANSHPNFRYISKIIDEKSNKLNSNIKIDQIRKIESFIYQSSLNKLPKFIIIDSADDLNISSSNSLLKLLEEPKNNSYFILIVHQLFNIMPTIRSRCIKFKFSHPSLENFDKIIRQSFPDIKEKDISLLYDLSNGSPGLAIQLYSNNIKDLLDNLLIIFNEKNNLSKEIINFSEIVGIYTNDQFKLFLSILKLILINILKVNLGINIKKYFLSNLSDTIHSISKNINNKSILTILDYLKLNENDLYIFNLEKKIFSINIFNGISK